MSHGTKGQRWTRIHTAIDERDATDRHRPCVIQIKRLWYQHDRKDWPEILENIVAMPRDNVFCITSA